MAISISKIMRRRRGFRILTVFACLALVLTMGGMMLQKGKKPVMAADIVVINSDSFFAERLIDGVHKSYWCPRASFSYINPIANTCVSGIDVTGKDVVVASGVNMAVYNATWQNSDIDAGSGIQLKSLTLESNATIYQGVRNTSFNFSQLSTESNLIDLKISDYLIIKEGAKISADGEGFHGGLQLFGDVGVSYLGGLPLVLANPWSSPTYIGGGKDGRSYALTTPVRYGWGGGGSGAKYREMPDSADPGVNAKEGGKAGRWNLAGVMTLARTDATSYNIFNGSGGGAACYYDNSDRSASCAPGSAGGGMVRIQVKNGGNGKLYIYPTAKISANGRDGASGWDTVPGAGGGGFVKIDSDNIYYNTNPSNLKAINVSGGSAAVIKAGPYINTSYPGEVGTIRGTITGNVGFTVEAKGGNAGTSNWNTGGYKGSGGAGGGGGVVAISGTLRPFCVLNTNSAKDPSGRYYIPDYCENQDVTIDGVKVYADLVPVWQFDTQVAVCSGDEFYDTDTGKCISLTNFLLRTNPTFYTAPKGESCYDVGAIYRAKYGDTDADVRVIGDSDCNTKRVLGSLKIINGGVLTHQAVTKANMDGYAVNNSLVGTSVDKIKKIDLHVAGNVTLDSGSSIDVSGKGYPGGYITWYGGSCVKDGEDYANTCPGISPISMSGNLGFGPGRGRGHSLVNINVNAKGGGGAYRGKGGFYTTAAGLPYTTDFDFGSGGGSATAYGDEEWSFGMGGPGGGRIRLAVDGQFIVKDAASRVKANGFVGFGFNGSSGTRSAGGGGAGGYINISASSFNLGSSRAIALLSGGAESGERGYVEQNIVINNVFEAAGASSTPSDNNEPGGGGSGGAIIITATATPASQPTINKELIAVSRTVEGAIAVTSDFNPYAAKIGDKIKVVLRVAGVPEADSTVEDEILKIDDNGQTTAICDPAHASVNPANDYATGYAGETGAYSATDKKITWTLHANSSDMRELSYQCVVTGTP